VSNFDLQMTGFTGAYQYVNGIRVETVSPLDVMRAIISVGAPRAQSLFLFGGKVLRNMPPFLGSCWHSRSLEMTIERRRFIDHLGKKRGQVQLPANE
jgi:hypothetical protein